MSITLSLSGSVLSWTDTSSQGVTSYLITNHAGTTLATVSGGILSYDMSSSYIPPSTINNIWYVRSLSGTTVLITSAAFSPPFPFSLTSVTLTTTGSNDAIVTKYNSIGSVDWIAQIGGGSSESAQSVATDSSGNIYVAGTYSSNPVIFYNASSSGATQQQRISNTGGNDVFLAKYNPSGAVVWAAQIGGNGSESAQSVATESYGNVYVTGRYSSNPVTFYNASGSGVTQSQTLLPANGSFFLAKYNPSGAVVWATSISGTNFGKVASDSCGNVYVAGHSNPFSTVTFYNASGSGVSQPTILNVDSRSDNYLVKYNPSGAIMWAAQFSGTGDDIVGEITVDCFNNICIIGNTTSRPLNFKNPSRTVQVSLPVTGPQGVNAGYTIKYSPNGEYVSRAAFYVTNVHTYGTSITSDRFGNVYVTGYFSSTPLNFYNTSMILQISLSANSYTNTFLAKYDYNGNVSWATQIAGSNSVQPYSLTVDSYDDILIMGTYTSTSLLFHNASGAGGSTTPYALYNASGNGGFLAKYNPFGTVISATSFGSNTVGQDVTSDTFGNIYAAVNYNSIVNIQSPYYVTLTDISGVFLKITGLLGTTYTIYTNGNLTISGSLTWNTDVPYSSLNRNLNTGTNTIYATLTDSSGVVSSSSNILTYSKILINLSLSGSVLSWTDTFPQVATSYRITNYAGTTLGTTSVPVRSYDMSSSYVPPSTINNVWYVTSYNGATIVGISAPFSPPFPFSLRTVSLGNAGLIDAFLTKYNTNGIVQWAAQIGGTGRDYVRGVITDSFGNVYIAGWYNGSNPLTLYNAYGSGITQLSLSGAEDGFLAKYNPSGAVVWATRMAGASNDTGLAVASDTFDNLYILGVYTSNPITFHNASGSGGTLTPILENPNTATLNTFLAKYNSSGAVVWATRMGGLGNDFGNSVITDSFGNTYVTGYYTSNPLTFYNASGSGGIHSLDLSNSGNNDAFLAKYNSNGAVVWATRIGGIGNDSGNNVTIDRFDNIYIAGHYSSNPVIFYNASGSGGIHSLDLSNGGLDDGFLAKYNSSGAVVWATCIAGVTYDYVNGVTSDSCGNIYVAGTYNSKPVIFYNASGSGGTRTQELSRIGGSSDAFLAKYNPSGAVVWATQIAGIGFDDGINVRSDSFGNTYITGFYTSDPLTFYNASGSGSTQHYNLPNTDGNRDIFLAKYTPNGEVVWATRNGGIGNDYSRGGITLDSVGNIYTTGDYPSTSLISYSAFVPILSDMSGVSIRVDGLLGTRYTIYTNGILTISGSLTWNTVVPYSSLNRNLNTGTNTIYATLTDSSGIVSASSNTLSFTVQPYSLRYAMITTNGVTANTVTGVSGTVYELVIPALDPSLNPVQEINATIFQNNTTIRSIYIGQNVRSIANNTFQNIPNLQSVVFDASSTAISIGYASFNSCPLLTSVTLPSSINTIRDEAFRFCGSLSTIQFSASPAPSTFLVDGGRTTNYVQFQGAPLRNFRLPYTYRSSNILVNLVNMVAFRPLSLTQTPPSFTNIPTGTFGISGAPNYIYYVAKNGILDSSGVLNASGMATVAYTNLSDGVYTYSISTYPASGDFINVISNLVSTSFTVDRQPPAFTTLSISGGTIYNLSYTLINVSGGTLYTNVSNGVVLVSISGEGAPVFYTAFKNELFDSSGTFLSISGGSIPYRSLADGSHNYSVVFQDLLGNQSGVRYTIVMYQSLRHPIIYGPLDNINTSGVTIVISGEVGRNYSLYLDGSLNAYGILTQGTTVSISGLTIGIHNVYVYSSYFDGIIILSSNTLSFTVHPPYSLRYAMITTNGVTANTVTGVSGTVYALVIPAFDPSLNPVQEINNTIFQNSTTIRSIYIGQNVRSIASNTFRNIQTLQSVVFDASSTATTIGFASFNSCPLLTSVTLPSSINLIRDEAFRICSKLSTIQFFASPAPSTVLNGNIHPFNHFQGAPLRNVRLPYTYRSSDIIYLMGAFSPLSLMQTPPSLTKISSGSFGISGDPNYIYYVAKNGILDSSGVLNASGMATFAYTNLSDGVYTYSISTYPASGDFINVISNLVSTSFTVDTQPPAFTTLSVSGGKSYSTTYTLINVSGGVLYTNVSNGAVLVGISGEAQPVFYTSTKDGVTDSSGTFLSVSGGSIPYRSLPDGPNNYSVAFQDAAGNQSGVSYTIVVVTQTPVYTTLTIRGGSSYNLSYTLINMSGGVLYTNVSNGAVLVSMSGEAVPVFYSSTKGTTPDSSGTFLSVSGGSIPYRSLADGSHNYSVEFQDAAGNRSGVSYTIVVDTVAPTQPTFLISGGTGQFSTNTNGGTIYTSQSSGIALITLLNESGTQYDVSSISSPGTIGIMDSQGGTFPYSFTGYGNQLYTIYLTDKAGNKRTYTLNITYLSSYIPDPFFSVNGVAQGTLTTRIYYTSISGGYFTLSGEPNMQFTIVCDAVQIYADSSFLSNSYRDISYHLSDGSHTYTVVLTNQTAKTATYSFTLFVVSQPPTQPSLSISGSIYYGNVFYTTFSGGYLDVSGLSGATDFTYNYVQTGVANRNVSAPYILGSSIPLLTTVDGCYNITVFFTDKALYTVSYSITAFVETRPPQITSVAIRNSTLSGGLYFTTFSGGTMFLGFSSETMPISYTYSQIDVVGTQIDISGPYNGVSLPLRTTVNSSYTIDIQITDVAGRTAATTIQVYVRIPPVIGFPSILNEEKTSTLTVSSATITFSGIPGTPYIVTGITPIPPIAGRFYTRVNPTIPESGTVTLTFAVSTGTYPVTIQLNPGTLYSSSLQFVIHVDTSQPSSSYTNLINTLLIHASVGSTYNIYADQWPSVLSSGKITSSSQLLPLSILGLSSGLQRITIQITDSFGNMKPYSIQMRILSYAPPPHARTYYPTPSQLTEYHKYSIEKCCI